MKQVYIHGLGQTPDSWNKVISQLDVVEHGVCPNLAELVRGKEVTYQNLYSSFSAVCDEINETVMLCGLSLGGVLALHYAIDHPEKVERLILIATQYKMPKKILKFQNIIFRFMPKSMFHKMGFKKYDFLTLCSTMMELYFSKSLQIISCPTLVVCGEKDHANKNASIELANLLSNAAFQELSRSGHEVNVDAPEKLANILGAFSKTKAEY